MSILYKIKSLMVFYTVHNSINRLPPSNSTNFSPVVLSPLHTEAQGKLSTLLPVITHPYLPRAYSLTRECLGELLKPSQMLSLQKRSQSLLSLWSQDTVEIYPLAVIHVFQPLCSLYNYLSHKLRVESMCYVAYFKHSV